MALQSMTALKSMSIEKLMSLRSDVEATLTQKVSEERRALEQELSKLGGYTGGGKKAKSDSRGAVAPKYRDPETGMYCGPVLRHPAEFMLPAVDLGGRVWL